MVSPNTDENFNYLTTHEASRATDKATGTVGSFLKREGYSLKN